MGSSEREHGDAAASRFVGRHGRNDFTAPTLRDLGRADWAAPDRAARLQAGIRGCFVLDRLQDLYFLAFLAKAQAFIESGFREK